MSWYFASTLKQKLALAKQIQDQNPGMTWQEAENQANQAILNAAAGKPQLAYISFERPRLLEEGLPIPPDHAFWLSIVYMMKKEPKMLERLAIKFMDTQARIIGNLAQAGAGNIITAYSHSFIIALMLEQNYMIRQRGADDLILSLNVLTAEQALAQLLQGFAVPEVLTFAATGVPISPRGMAGLTGAAARIPKKE